MAKFTPKTFETHLQRMIDRVVARTGLSDLTDASIFKHILAAVARELDDVDFQMLNLLDLFNIDRATGDDLDERAAEIQPGTLLRKVAIQAFGNVEFTRTTSNPGPGDIIIPIGTRVEVPGEDPPIIFQTTAVGTIPVANSTTGDVAALAETAGVKGNVVQDTITSFKGAKPSGVNAVNNPADFVGGQNKETDDAFRTRLKNFVASLSRCTPLALEQFASEVSLPTGQRVEFVKAVEDIVTLGLVRLFIEDGAGTTVSTANNTSSPEILTSGPDFPGDVAQGGETQLFIDNFPLVDTATILVEKTPGPVTLIRNDTGANGYTLNPASGQILLNTALLSGDAVTIEYTWYTGLIAAVQKVIDGDENDRENFPGVRAAGVLVLVLSPTLITVTIDMAVIVLSGFDRPLVLVEITDALKDYVNTLGIGNDVLQAEIIERAMRIDGVFNVNLTVPANDVLVLEDRIARVQDSDITLS